MPNPDDEMDRPVTKRELHEALELWGGDLEARIDQKIDRCRVELRAELRADLRAEMQVWGRQLSSEIQTWGRQLSAELKQHTGRILEETRAMVGVVDAKYSDLPGRVTALEDKVLAPKRRRSR